MKKNYSIQFYGCKEDWLTRLLVILENKDDYNSFSNKGAIINELYQFIRKRPFFSKPLNIEWATVKDGRIDWSLSNQPDLLNNMALATYDKLEQFYENRITTPMERDINQAIYNALNAIGNLVYFFDADYLDSEPDVLEKLRSETYQRELTEYQYMRLVYEMTSVVALSEGSELYTIDEMAQYYKSVSSYLKLRKEEYDLQSLLSLTYQFVSVCDNI